MNQYQEPISNGFLLELRSYMEKCDIGSKLLLQNEKFFLLRQMKTTGNLNNRSIFDRASKEKQRYRYVTNRFILKFNPEKSHFLKKRDDNILHHFVSY